jgi:hypothetical protein
MTPNLVAIAGVPAAPARKLISCTGDGIGTIDAEQRAFSWLAAGFFLAGAAFGYYLVRTERA